MSLFITQAIGNTGEELSQKLKDIMSALDEDPNQSLVYLNSLLTQSSDQGETAQIQYCRALVFRRLGNNDSALSLLETTFELFDKLENDSMAFESLFEAGIIKRKSGLFNEAMADYQKAKHYAEEKGMRVLEGDALNALGVAHYNQGLNIQALEYYLQALSIYEELKAIEKMGKSYNNIGVIYKINSNYKKAIEYYRKSIEIKIQMGNYESLYYSFFNINELHRFNKNYLEALKISKEALKLAEKYDIDWWKSESHEMLATDYQNLEQFDSMLFHIEKFMDFVSNDEIDQAEASLLQGRYYTSIGEYENAEHFLNRAYEIFKSKNYRIDLLITLLNYAALEKERGNFTQSLALNSEARTLALEQDYSVMLMSLMFERSQIFEQMGIYDSALFLHKKYKAMEDAQYNESKAGVIGGMEAEMRLQLNKKEKEILQKEAEIQTAVIKRQDLIIKMSVIGLMAFTAIVLFVLNALKQKRRLAEVQLAFQNEQNKRIYDQLQFKEKELVNFALQLAQKNDFIQEVSTEMEILSKKNDISNQDVREITKKLRLNEILTQSQEEFDAHVKSVNSSFYEKLEKKHPGLTVNEKKLATLLRLKLSSKEIASIIGISAKSVDMSRYRLRKKMEIQQSEDLIETLQRL